MHYGETKRVRAIQGEQFIVDFKSVRTVVVFAYLSEDFLAVLKLDVWALAKTKKLTYKMMDDIFANRRLVMVIY